MCFYETEQHLSSCPGWSSYDWRRTREKMICRILLLVKLTSCVCGVFEPRNMGLNYQAEENSNITVEWSFSSKVHVSISSLKIHCVSVPEIKVFYHQDHSVDESLDEQFAGRVQCDEDALRSGRVRLHVSRVRIDDSGLYLCRMATEFGRKVKQFSLKITEASVKPKDVTPKPAAVIRGRLGLCVALGLSAAAAAAAAAAAVLALCRSTSSCRPPALHCT